MGGEYAAASEYDCQKRSVKREEQLVPRTKYYLWAVRAGVVQSCDAELNVTMLCSGLLLSI